MHTAYDRKDNSEPASITALAVSKDHRTLYVGEFLENTCDMVNFLDYKKFLFCTGDARGRVFSWCVTDGIPGRMDHWLKDEITDSCTGCRVK